jgi:hypothetical protein
MIGSCHTVPVNQSPGIRRDGTDPDSLMSMISPQRRFARCSKKQTATSPASQEGYRKTRVNIIEWALPPTSKPLVVAMSQSTAAAPRHGLLQ